MAKSTAKACALQSAFADQARACKRLGSPFTALICSLFAKRKLPRGPVADKLMNWPGELGANGDSVPLRLAAALHALVLERKSEDLARLYPVNDPDSPNVPTNPDDLWAAISDALSEHKLFLLSRLQLAPQTNDVSRSATLIGALQLLSEHSGMPLALSELGASAGLNLHPEKYRYEIRENVYGDPLSTVVLSPQWDGALPSQHTLRIHGRAGCDINPLNPVDRLDQLRLLSFIWPDQHDRMARTRAAARLVGADSLPASANASHWLEQRLATPMPGALHVVFHTIAWQYFKKVDADECALLISEAGKRATSNAPLAWLRLESDGGQPGAPIVLSLWPEAKTYVVGRADYHGQWVKWRGWPATKSRSKTAKKTAGAKTKRKLARSSPVNTAKRRTKR